MSNQVVSPRLHKLLMAAAREIKVGSYTTAQEIEEEMLTRTDWMQVYGLEEIKLRDIVIEKLLGGKP